MRIIEVLLAKEHFKNPEKTKKGLALKMYPKDDYKNAMRKLNNIIKGHTFFKNEKQILIVCEYLNVTPNAFFMLKNDLIKAVDNQVKDFELPTQKIDIEFILEQLFIRFHQSKNNEDCKKIIEVFRGCNRNIIADEMEADLKIGS